MNRAAVQPHPLHRLQSEWDQAGALSGFRRTAAQIRALARAHRAELPAALIALPIAALAFLALAVVLP